MPHVVSDIDFDIDETVVAFDPQMANLWEANPLMPSITTTSAPILFGQSLQSTKRSGKRIRASNPEQGSLFGLN
jgi:hypothetical protein